MSEKLNISSAALFSSTRLNLCLAPLNKTTLLNIDSVVEHHEERIFMVVIMVTLFTYQRRLSR